MMCQRATTRTISRALLSLGVVLLVGCGRGDPDPAKSIGMPSSFSPAEKVVQANDRTVRCNTVHSMTLPPPIVDRLNFTVAPDTAVISCSLQVVRDGRVLNLPARVLGTVTTLSGNIAEIDFKQVLEEETVSYVGQFTIDGKAGVRFDVTVVDPQSGARYELDFEQIRI